MRARTLFHGGPLVAGRARLLSIGVVTGVMLVFAASGATKRANAGFQPTPGCEYRANVSAIIDDSGSTSGTDPAELRAAAVRFLISRQLTATGFPERRLAAVQFGDDASTVFGPTPINSANQAAMNGAVDTAIQADDGGTNYNAAFFFDNALYPGHDARIFFTDGEHNVGPYQNLHRPGPKTHVLGLNVTDADGAALLDRIASETGGFHIPLNEAIEVPTQMDRVFADLSCVDPPEQSVVTPPAAGEQKTVLKAPVKKVDQALSLAIFTGEIPSGDFQVKIKDKNNAKHRVTSQFSEASSSAKGPGCRTKAKKGKKKGKKRKPKLKVECSADAAFHVMQLTGRKGSVRKALGKKLKVKLRTDEDAFIPFDAELTTSLTRER